MADATIKEVAEFFKIGDGSVSADSRNSLSNFGKEWRELDEAGKTQLREGIGNGSLTY
jgi:hypothetical protein